MKKMNWMLPLLLLLIGISACNTDDSYFDEEDVDTFEEEGNGHDEHGEEGLLTLYTVQGDQISRKQDFNVSGQLLEFQQDYDKHFKMWEFTRQLIPAGERGRITEFMVFFGNDDLAGYVEPVNENDLSKWRMGLAIDLADKLEEIDFTNFFTYVTIHEFGHIATLNETQIDVQINEASCNSYFPGEGCARTSSYINNLFELGWADIYDGEDSNTDFYAKYPERFVTDYAASNPAEDIAEVFAYFVTKANQPSGHSIADQKIKMLYNYPELVKLREDMRGNPTLRAMKPGSWKTNPYIKKYKFGKHQHAIQAQKTFQ